MGIRQAIELAKQHLDTDPHLAVFILRDFQEVEALGLSDLAWSMTREYPHKNDAVFFIEELERGLDSVGESEVAS